MIVIYELITLVYAHPKKYVSVIMRCLCSCGTNITTNAKKCQTYGRVIVRCKRCKDEGILPLDRQTVADFHKTHYPHLSGVDFFLDKWEEGML